MDISTLAVCLLGIGATLKYAYKVFIKKNYKSSGAFIATLYLTLVYGIISIPDFPFHGGIFVRVGIVLIFADKIIIFANDLINELSLIGGGVLSKLIRFVGGSQHGK